MLYTDQNVISNLDADMRRTSLGWRLTCIHSYMHPFMPYLVYSISGDEEATHRTVSNTGREAQAYVQFIVNYYECLPKVCPDPALVLTIWYMNDILYKASRDWSLVCFLLPHIQLLYNMLARTTSNVGLTLMDLGQSVALFMHESQSKVSAAFI